MPTGYYIHKPKTEWEAVERWENEGGRLGQIMAVNEKAKSITGRTVGVDASRLCVNRFSPPDYYASSNAS